MDDRLTAANRFGLGARIGEVERMPDPRAWLRAQLDDPGRAAEAWVAEPYSVEELTETLARLREAVRSGDQGRAAEARRAMRDVATTEMSTLLRHRVTTDAPFVERLVAFWSNHLCVSITKPQVTALAGHYERTAIRPYVLGRFHELVLASARHPAMLLYLDNAQSVGPRSAAGRRTARGGRARGLNENYARELLELHTLGVNGGYDQTDVEELARVLTGWSVEEGVFAFRRGIHEPGSKTVLGVRYAEAGVREGEAAIRDLCARPSTAEFVSEKLVRHFVSDDPPEDAVRTVATAFTESGGDLRIVAETLVDLEAAWSQEAGKMRSPQEWLVATLRAFRIEEVPGRAAGVLRQLRHTPWAPPSPKGFPDTASEWADPDSLMNRAELSRTLARSFGRGAAGRGGGALDPGVVLQVAEVPDADPLRALLADASIPADERLALALAGPAFQWR